MRRTHAIGRRRTALAAALMVFLVAGFLFAAASAGAAVVYNSDVDTMITNVSQDELEPAVNELSGVTPATTIFGLPYFILTRASSSGEPIDMAERYIYDRLSSYGLSSVAYQDYPGQGFVVRPGRNIIGEITGTKNPNEIIIIGAHLDDRPQLRVIAIAPGADDDASGVSANLYLARSFAGKTFERTIRFVFFGSEENAPWTSNHYGSGYYADQAKLAGENIVAMIQADALAYIGTETKVARMVTRTARKDPGGGDAAIFTMWQEAVSVYRIDIEPTQRATGTNLSDHGPFWQNGYHAVMLIHSGGNPNWHTVDDTVLTFTWPYYVEMTKSLVAVAAHEAGITE